MVRPTISEGVKFGFGPNDPLPFTFKQGSSRGLLLGDHAGKIIPECLHNLGLGAAWPQIQASHIACDHGIAEVANHMAELTGYSLIKGEYSRLVVDLNRDSDDVTSIRALYDGQAIYGNYQLGEAERNWRMESIYKPYHQAVAGWLNVAEQRYNPSFDSLPVLSLHSFTPSCHGVLRPWQMGVLSHQDRRMADHLLAWLASHYPALVVGDNQPYSGIDPYGYTLEHHVVPLQLPHVLIEIRQDEIADKAGQLDYAKLLAAWLATWEKEANNLKKGQGA